MSLFIRNYTESDRDACRSIFVSNIPKFFAPVELIDFDSWLAGYRKQDVSADTVDAYFVLEEDGRCWPAVGSSWICPVGRQR
jgi:hypothetical protein